MTMRSSSGEQERRTPREGETAAPDDDAQDGGIVGPSGDERLEEAASGAPTLLDHPVSRIPPALDSAAWVKPQTAPSPRRGSRQAGYRSLLLTVLANDAEWELKSEAALMLVDDRPAVPLLQALLGHQQAGDWAKLVLDCDGELAAREDVGLAAWSGARRRPSRPSWTCCEEGPAARRSRSRRPTMRGSSGAARTRAAQPPPEGGDAKQAADTPRTAPRTRPRHRSWRSSTTPTRSS